ncbi:MAG: hypothetical protein IT373_15060 [Polyangiaceae bacterium]|nr:hypothetical protein [Polyangiaceae bacterium]
MSAIIRIQVRWSGANGPHGLLDDDRSEITLGAVGTSTAFSPTRTGPGIREYHIPAVAAELNLLAVFSASFGPGEVIPTLRIKQDFYLSESGTLTAVPYGAFGGVPHPLVNVRTGANVNAAFAIELDVSFVDVTAFWRPSTRVASPDDDYVQDSIYSDNSSFYVALGCTVGTPLIWLVHGSSGLAVKDSLIPAVAFFRPPNLRPYSSIGDKHEVHRFHRYLLDPKFVMLSQDPPIGYPRLEGTTGFTAFQDQGTWKTYEHVRCRFESALCGYTHEGRKGEMVMVHPWPQGTSYGDAEGPLLWERVRACVRLLWANQVIAQRESLLPDLVGGFCLAAFARGGPAMWNALAHARDRVSVIMSFDTTGLVERHQNDEGQELEIPSLAAARVLQWFRASARHRLLMTGAVNHVPAMALMRSIASVGIPPEHAAQARLFPPNNSYYVDPTLNPHWLELQRIRKYPFDGSSPPPGVAPVPARTPSMWQQFAVFGGEPFQPNSLATWGVASTYLAHFLALSGL